MPLCERQGFFVKDRSALRVKSVGTGRNIAEQVPRSRAGAARFRRALADYRGFSAAWRRWVAN